MLKIFFATAIHLKSSTAVGMDFFNIFHVKSLNNMQCVKENMNKKNCTKIKY